MTSNRAEAAEQGWDGPWYRVRTERFEASFLLSEGEPLDAVCNVDVEVRLTADASRCLNGRYFRCSDGLIVRDAGIDNITHVLTGLLDGGDFTQVLQRLDDD
ncbi:hypothetical protein [Streptomyces albogriseolus]|uniref:hypothetical protein n=1 Tax=Streptomyces albogriseolus TaxID=1887 RepID=UPI0036FF322D